MTTLEDILWKLFEIDLDAQFVLMASYRMDYKSFDVKKVYSERLKQYHERVTELHEMYPSRWIECAEYIKSIRVKKLSAKDFNDIVVKINERD